MKYNKLAFFTLAIIFLALSPVNCANNKETTTPTSHRHCIKNKTIKPSYYEKVTDYSKTAVCWSSKPSSAIIGVGLITTIVGLIKAYNEELANAESGGSQARLKSLQTALKRLLTCWKMSSVGTDATLASGEIAMLLGVTGKIIGTQWPEAMQKIYLGKINSPTLFKEK